MKKILYILAVSAMTLFSCNVNDPIYETAHPGSGQITLTTDWTKRTDGIAIPANYTACVGAEQATMSGTTATYPKLVAPGTYTLYVFNIADKITVSGTTATVATVSSTTIDPMPGWLFSGKTGVTVVADKTQDVKAVMKQEVCQLDMELTVTEGDPARISGITGTLTGIAGAWNFDTDSPAGNAVSVKPAFTRTGNKITATMRLLGIVPTAMQELALVVTFSDNSQQTITKELSSLLTGFNTDQHIAVKITADVHTPIEVGFNCTINGWQAKDIKDGTAQ